MHTPSITPTPVVILVNPQLGENIGTAARAMANFGLTELRIVNPRDGWPNPRALSAASGANWIIEKAQVFDHLADALVDLSQVYATTARQRDMVKPVLTPEQCAQDMHLRLNKQQKIGLLFGRERWGLNNDEVAQANSLVMAPVNPEFASLNIAQAVLLVGYEWFKLRAPSLGMGTEESPALETPGLMTPATRLATQHELSGFFSHLEHELEEAGYFKSKDMQPRMMRNLRNLFLRADMTEQEVRTFRGLVASLVRAHQRPKASKAPQAREIKGE